MAKNIKNYTTEIPAQRTIMEIQNMLLEAGAVGIAAEKTGFSKLLPG